MGMAQGSTASDRGTIYRTFAQHQVTLIKEIEMRKIFWSQFDRLGYDAAYAATLIAIGALIAILLEKVISWF